MTLLSARPAPAGSSSTYASPGSQERHAAAVGADGKPPSCRATMSGDATGHTHRGGIEILEPHLLFERRDAVLRARHHTMPFGATVNAVDETGHLRSGAMNTGGTSLGGRQTDHCCRPTGSPSADPDPHQGSPKTSRTRGRPWPPGRWTSRRSLGVGLPSGPVRRQFRVDYLARAHFRRPRDLRPGPVARLASRHHLGVGFRLRLAAHLV